MTDEPESDEMLLDEPVEETSEPEDIVLEFEGDEQQEETPLIKQLRQRERDLARENAELKKGRPAPQRVEVGDKPTLESCDFDPDRYERERDAWDERRAEAARQDQASKDAEQARNHTFERAMSTYRDQASKLGIAGFDEAESAVRASLSPEVQGIVVQYFKEPAKLVAALGKSPLRLAAISAEPDPMRQIMMLRDAEGAIKMTNRRKPPEPEAETIQRGSAPVARQSDDKKLKKLEDEARRTGNRTALIAYKESLKEKAK